jgi:hypothetical protein
MLAAELHGKISDGNLSDRMEDVLTSYVLSLFRYLNNLHVPLQFLSKAKNWYEKPLHIGKAPAIELFFWPKFSLNNKSWREPDGLLICCENNCDVVIGIEAKYLSGFSNIHNLETDGDISINIERSDNFQYGHQIADEYCGLYCGNWNLKKETQPRLSRSNRKHLVIITKHYELPKQDLEEATRIVKERKCYNAQYNCGLNPEENIYWVSWSQLTEILEAESKRGYPYYSQGERNLLEDVRSMLIRRGLVPFSVWQNLQPVLVY